MIYIIPIIGIIGACVGIIWWVSGKTFPEFIRMIIKKKPKLSLSVKIIQDGIISGPFVTRYDCKIILGIKNNGKNSIKHPYLTLKVFLPYKISKYGLDGNYNTGLPKVVKGNSEPGVTQYGANTSIMIHPNSVLEVTSIHFDIPENATEIKDVVIESKISAEDIKPILETTTIKGEEILKKILPKRT